MKKLSVVAFSICALSLLSGCEDYFTFVIKPAEIKVECENEGEMTCNDNSDGTYTIFKCENGKQELKETCNNVSCKKQENSTYTCGECVSGIKEYQFNNDNQCTKRICMDGEWSELQLEENIALCGCTEGETRYYPSEDGNCSHQICSNNLWIEDNNCGTVSCYKDLQGKYSCGECLNNVVDYQLNEHGCKFRYCENGKWSNYEDAEGNAKCGCEDDDIQFYPSNNNSECYKQICKDNRWINDSKCQVSEQPVSCQITEDNEDGIVYGCGECKDGQSTCENQGKGEIGLMKKCQFGKWVYQVCDETSCHENACGECKNGMEKCIDSEDSDISSYLLICIDGKWKRGAECLSASCNASKDACGECFNNQTQCLSILDDNNNEFIDFGQVQQCIYGKWENLYPCRAIDEKRLSCKKNCEDNLECTTLCGNCQNGDRKIREVEDICSVYECKNGDWIIEDTTQDTVSCNYSSNGEIKMGECLNGTRQCNGDMLQVCANGKYDDFMTCKGCEISEDNSVNCKTDCVSSNIQVCNDNEDHVGVYFKCENGISTVNPCLNENMCNATQDNCGECHYLEEACRNDDNNIGYSQICENGAFVDLSENPCPSNHSCAGQKCGECHNGDFKCEDNDNNSIIYKCIEGIWISDHACESLNSCADATQCGICKNGTTRYENNVNQNCVEYECKAGQWTEKSSCAGNVSCTSDKACGECVNYSFSTNDKDLFTCLNGKKESNEDCDLWPHQYWADKPRFVRLGDDYIGCYESDFNGNEKINCYNKKVDNKLIGYKRSDDKVCGNNVSCHVKGVNETECGECQELSTRCSNKKSQTCINGQWINDLPEWHTADRCAE